MTIRDWIQVRIRRGQTGGAVSARDYRPDEMDDMICEIMHDEVAAMFWAQLPEMFRSIKTAMVEYFDARYAALTEAAAAAATMVVSAAGLGASRGFQYRDFDNMKPPNFDGIQDSIIAMRWLSDIKGCFFTCS